MNYDVVICGYGPTGAVAANLLGRRGVRVLVVEQNTEIYDIPRAVHFDGETMRIFQVLGLADEIKSVSTPATEAAFVNGSGRTLMALDFRDMPRRHGWPNGNFFNQPALEAYLRRGVERYPSVEVRLGWALETFDQDDAGLHITLSHRESSHRDEVTSSYFLGCDGATSTARELVDIPLDTLNTDEPWLVCDILLEGDFEFRKRVYQVCDRRRPTTLVPCEGRHIRWEFMLRPDDDPEELEREETVLALMAPHLHRLHDDLKPEQCSLIRKKVYTFHGLIARSWRSGRVLLLGDAAHQTPPFLGQGMCAGIRDAYNLCWKLEGVLAGRYTSKLLDSYPSERAPHARTIIEQAIRTGSVIQTRNPIAAFLRDSFFSLARIFPFLQKPFLWEPAWPLGPGFFDTTTPPSAQTAHGHQIDQPVVATMSGERIALDTVLGDDFTVLGLNMNPADTIAEATAQTFSTLKTRFVQVASQATHGDTASSNATTVVEDGNLTSWFKRIGGGQAVTLRSDRQVFGVYGKNGASTVGTELGTAAEKLLTMVEPTQ